MTPINLDLRSAVMAKLSGSSVADLRDTIVDAIQSREEKTLPGLGVLFEIVWEHSNPEAREKMLQIVAENL